MKIPRITDILFYTTLLAIIFMLVRPGSPSTKVLQTLTDASAAIIGAATGNFV